MVDPQVDAVGVAAAEVWVEDRTAALLEAGDLIQAEIAGAWSSGAIRGDLSELCSGRTASTRSGGRPTLFKGVGLTGEDLVVAAAIVGRQKRRA